MGFYIGIPHKQSYTNENGQTITIAFPDRWSDFGPQILQSDDGRSYTYIGGNYWDYRIFNIYNDQLGQEVDYVVYYIEEDTLVNMFNQQLSPFAHNYSSSVSGETSLPTGTRLWRYSETIGRYQSAWPSGFGDSGDANQYNVGVYLFDQDVTVQPTTIIFKFKLSKISRAICICPIPPSTIIKSGKIVLFTYLLEIISSMVLKSSGPTIVLTLKCR